MKAAVAVAAATLGGAAIAWVFIRHGSEGWWVVGLIALTAAIAEVVLRASARGLDATTACSRMGTIGRAAAVSIFCLGLLGAAGAAYAGAETISFGDPPQDAPQSEKDRVASENKVLGVGLAAIGVALTSVLVDTLKSGPVGARVRRVYGKKFPNHRLMGEKMEHHWASFERRSTLCEELRTEPQIAPGTRTDAAGADAPPMTSG